MNSILKDVIMYIISDSDIINDENEKKKKKIIIKILLFLK